MQVLGRHGDTPRADSHHERGFGRRSRLFRIVRGLIAIVVVCVLAVIAGIAVLWPLTPSVKFLPSLVAHQTAAHGGTVLRGLPAGDRIGAAVVATENSRFWSDPGVDPIGVARVVLGAVHGQNAGGATIEQQLAKLVYGSSWPGPLSTLEQVELGIKIAHSFPKPEILRLYLSEAYFGQGYYGITAAAQGYFRRSPATLSWGQAAMLAGLVQAPSVYDPLVHLGLARDREHDVLSRLVATGHLTPAQAEAAYQAPLQLS